MATLDAKAAKIQFFVAPTIICLQNNHFREYELKNILNGMITQSFVPKITQFLKEVNLCNYSYLGYHLLLIWTSMYRYSSHSACFYLETCILLMLKYRTLNQTCLQSWCTVTANVNPGTELHFTDFITRGELENVT